MEQVRIRVETSVLEERADFAEQKIQCVQSHFEKIDQIVKNSKNYWEGDANDAHIREFQEYQDDIDEILARFRENVTDLRKIAGVYQEAEKAAAEISSDLPMDVII